MPAFVQSMAKEKVSRIKRTDHREMWEADALLLKTRLEHRIFGGFPRTSPWTFEPGTTSEGQDTRRETLTLFPEPGMPVPAVLVRGRALRGPLPTAVIVNPTGKESALESRQVHGLLSGGWQIVAMDLRATGATAIRNDVIAGAVGHNSVEWSNWMGRPLLGQWCWDVIRMLDYLTARDDVEARNIALVSRGAGALVAVCAGCLDERVHAVATFGMLASFLTPSPFQGHHMATMVPFLLDIGDVEHLAALLAPRDLIIAGPVNAKNLPLSDQDSRAAFQFTRRTYGWFQAVRQLRVDAEFPDELLAEKLHGT